MQTRQIIRWMAVTAVPFFLAPLLTTCDDGTGPEEQTGATIQGTVVQFNALGVNGVKVRVGEKSTKTDGSGNFTLRNAPLGDQTMDLSNGGSSGSYLVEDVAQGESFVFRSIQVNSGQVTTEHTGTWVGKGGSTDPSSQGLVPFTMIIEANGNNIKGTAFIPPPDSTTWSFKGSENGITADGKFGVVSTLSSCATGGTFEATFTADTLEGSFVEANPPDGCGPPEEGVFRVVKQG